MTLEVLWRLKDHVQHSVIAAAFMLVFGLLAWVLGQSHPAVLGALAGILWFHGREVADADSINRNLLNTVKALWPGYWDADSRKDFLYPLASNSALAVLVEVLL